MGSSAHDPIPTNNLLTGRRDTLDRLMPEVYEGLRVIARRQLAGREGGGTLSTTGADLDTWDRPLRSLGLLRVTPR